MMGTIMFEVILKSSVILTFDFRLQKSELSL